MILPLSLSFSRGWMLCLAAGPSQDLYTISSVADAHSLYRPRVRYAAAILS